MKALYLLLSIFILAASANAASSSINAFLQSYNLSSSTISGLTSTNITYQGSSYTELFLNGNPYLLINTTNPSSLSFVFTTQQIANVIRNNSVQSEISNLNLPEIASEMTSFLSSSNSSLSDCLVETGLDRGTCSLANYCQSCAEVPSCNKVLYGTGGPSDTFGEGIITFENQYAALEANESILYSATSNVSAKNVLGDVGRVNYAFDNISNITNMIYENPIFPAPASVDLSQCNAIGTQTLNTSLQGAPWFCNAVGFCEFLTYNYTQLAVIQTQVNLMNSNAPTATYVDAQAQAINTTEQNLITPLLLGKKAMELNTILNTTLANYTVVVGKSTALLTHISNSSLLASLTQLETDYASLKAGYLSLNLTTYSATVSSDLSSVVYIYNQQAPLYPRIVEMAKNNTALIIGLQSESNNPQLSALAFEEDQLNLQVNSRINSTSAITANLTKVNSGARALEAISVNPAASSRATDGPFATAMASALGFSYSAAVASIPLFASFLSLLIGLVVLIIIYAFYYSLKKSNRLRMNRNTSKAWRDLFAVVIVIILIYVGITYYYAAQANGNAPIALFTNAVYSSKSVGIVLNGTVTPGMLACASILGNETVALHKQPYVVYTAGNLCTINGNTTTTGACLNEFVAKGVPFIMLTSSNYSDIHAYSMYGTALYAQGNDAFMSSCYPSFFLK